MAAIGIVPVSRLGIEPALWYGNGSGSLIAFVVSLSIERHLTESQPLRWWRRSWRNMKKLATISMVVRCATHAVGKRTATLLQVSPRSVANARAVYTGGAPR